MWSWVFFEEGEVPLSFVGEAFDYFVNFEVKESARQRADRIWRMEDRNDG